MSKRCEHCGHQPGPVESWMNRRTNGELAFMTAVLLTLIVITFISAF